ncbi:PREDICTED: dual specificity protein phosphatase 3-like isoform X2 [Branchiostoma belcheri]|uniref:protein-serine/threonine phosphatase n=1 Tax=Branchiostoma belcheri TaxID=7741 RepID=A0A6P4XBT1_BRABE|nr:PREDICTED: dual specificity protein phosphatase 3-like isoform X2 [Branchiostoma belcheri]
MMTTNIANPGYRPQTMASFDRFSRYNYIGSAYGRLGGSTGALDRSYGTTTSGTTSALKTIGLPTKTSTKTVTFAPGTRGKDMSYSDRYSSSDRYTSSSAPLSSYRSSVGNLLSSTSTYRDSYGYRQDRDYDSSKYSSRLSTSSHPTANTSSSYGRYSSGEYSSTSATSKSSSGGYCTADDLSECLRGGVGAYISHTSYNEVFPNIFIGDHKAAENYEMLNRYGVTHVVNAAHGDIDNEWEYRGMGIHYLGVDADDTPYFDISEFFVQAAEFIKQARKLGKVLVHCAVGFSRSPTLVVAYLMLYHRMSAQEALKTIRAKRMIGPNRGFLRQLADFNNKLLAEGRIRPYNGR